MYGANILLIGAMNTTGAFSVQTVSLGIRHGHISFERLFWTHLCLAPLTGDSRTASLSSKMCHTMQLTVGTCFQLLVIDAQS